jgi:hypothetical protein
MQALARLPQAVVVDAADGAAMLTLLRRLLPLARPRHLRLAAVAADSGVSLSKGCRS